MRALVPPQEMILEVVFSVSVTSLFFSSTEPTPIKNRPKPELVAAS